MKNFHLRQTSLGGHFACFFLMVLGLSSSAQTETTQTLTEMEYRILQLAPKVEDLFYEARDDFDRLALKVGQSRFAKRYVHKKKASSYKAPSYKGYVLKGGPYDPKEECISFRKGSDCSHFIHRFFSSWELG
jgi:hypothetical protein